MFARFATSFVEFGWAFVSIFFLVPIQHSACRISALGTNFKAGPGISLGRPTEWSDLLGPVASNLGVCPRAAPMPNLQDPATYLGFLARTFDFLPFPHRSRHPRAAAAELNGKTEEWGRTQVQVRDGGQ